MIARQRPWEHMDTEAITTTVVQRNERPTWTKKSIAEWKSIVEALWQTEQRMPLQDVLVALDSVVSPAAITNGDANSLSL